MRFQQFLYCSLLLWPGYSAAQSPVPNLEDRRLFMSIEQRAAIDQSGVAVISEGIASSIEETAVEQVPEYRSPGRKLKLNGIVMRSDGKVFGWVNSNSAREVRPQNLAANGNGAEKFIVTDKKELVTLSPGQSIVLEPRDD